MHGSPFNPSASCSVCTQTECPLSEGACPEQTECNRPMEGTRFSFACAMVFLLPIVLAILASVSFASDPNRGLLAGLVGFLIGSLLSALITRLSRMEGARSH